MPIQVHGLFLASLVMFQLLSWAQSIAEATAGCLGSLPVPALAGRAGSLLEAAMGWIQPTDSTTGAFYSILPPLCLPSTRHLT